MDVPTIQELVRALGRSDALAVIDRFCAGGQASLLAFLDWLAEPNPRVGDGRNTRAVLEDEEWLLTRLATAHPDVLLERLEHEPKVTIGFLMLSALSRLDHPGAHPYLVAALESSSGSERWLALKSLLRKADPAGTVDLVRFLRDRDGLVRFEAAKGLRLHGSPDDIAALLDYGSEAPIGGREAAFDAIEAICLRHGLPLPAAHPGARLVRVDLPEAPSGEVTLRISEALQVARGDVLAELGPCGPLRSPCDGVVVAIDEMDGRPTAIVIRLRV